MMRSQETTSTRKSLLPTPIIQSAPTQTANTDTTITSTTSTTTTNTTTPSLSPSPSPSPTAANTSHTLPIDLLSLTNHPTNPPSSLHTSAMYAQQHPQHLNPSFQQHNQQQHNHSLSTLQVPPTLLHSYPSSVASSSPPLSAPSHGSYPQPHASEAEDVELLPDSRTLLIEITPTLQHTRKVMQKTVNMLKNLTKRYEIHPDIAWSLETAVEMLISHRPPITSALNRLKARLSAPDSDPVYVPKSWSNITSQVASQAFDSLSLKEAADTPLNYVPTGPTPQSQYPSFHSGTRPPNTRYTPTNIPKHNNATSPNPHRTLIDQPVIQNLSYGLGPSNISDAGSFSRSAEPRPVNPAYATKKPPNHSISSIPTLPQNSAQVSSSASSSTQSAASNMMKYHFHGHAFSLSSEMYRPGPEAQATQADPQATEPLTTPYNPASGDSDSLFSLWSGYTPISLTRNVPNTPSASRLNPRLPSESLGRHDGGDGLALLGSLAYEEFDYEGSSRERTQGEPSSVSLRIDTDEQSQLASSTHSFPISSSNSNPMMGARISNNTAAATGNSHTGHGANRPPYTNFTQNAPNRHNYHSTGMW